MNRNNREARGRMKNEKIWIASTRVAGALLVLGFATGAAFAAGNPTPYTKAQAKAGLQVYSSNCASCHGANLQGVAAPAIAGKDFLKTAKSNKWSLATIDQIVVNNMPFSAPGSLTPKQYADVIAYLLAANCFKAGNTPFPATAPASFAKVKLEPPATKNPDADKNGVCSLKS